MSERAPTLKSLLLRDNQRLNDCAQFDRSHILPGEAGGDHLRLVNEGPRKIARDYPADGYLTVPPSVTTLYAPQSVAAVRVLKRKAPPLYTHGVPGQFDDIIGTGTIRRLDGLLADKDPKPAPAPTPKVVRLELSGQCQTVGHRMDDLNAGDLQVNGGVLAVKTARTAAIIAPFMALPDLALAATKNAGVMAMVVLGATQKAASAGVLAEPVLVNARFDSGAGLGDRIWEKGSAVSDYAKDAPGLEEFIGGVRSDIRREVGAAVRRGVVNDVAVAAAVKPGIDGRSVFAGGALSGFIGGVQGFNLKMCGLAVDVPAKTCTFHIDAQFFDHFGVDHTDVDRTDSNNVAAACLATWFVLQHFRGGVQFRPFRTVLKVDYGPFTESF